MHSTKDVILVLITVIGVLALFLEIAGIITVDQFGIIILILIALPIIHKFLGKD